MVGWRDLGSSAAISAFCSLEIGDRLSVKSGERLQFNEIDPPFTGFALRDERLWLLEPCGDLDLGQAGLVAGLLEPL